MSEPIPRLTVAGASAAGMDGSTRTTATAHVPLIEPEQCAYCYWRAPHIREMIAARKTNPFVNPPRRWTPIQPRHETCACGYSVLRGFNPTSRPTT